MNTSIVYLLLLLLTTTTAQAESFKNEKIQIRVYESHACSHTSISQHSTCKNLIADTNEVQFSNQGKQHIQIGTSYAGKPDEDFIIETRRSTERIVVTYTFPKYGKIHSDEALIASFRFPKAVEARVQKADFGKYSIEFDRFH